MTVTHRPVGIDQTFDALPRADIQVAIAGQEVVAVTEALLALEEFGSVLDLLEFRLNSNKIAEASRP